MAMTLEFRWHDQTTLGELAEFVSTAKAGGVRDDDLLEPTIVDEDQLPEQDGWRVVLGQSSQDRAAEVRVPISLIRSTVELLNLVAESGGDVEGLQEGVVKTRDELLQAIFEAARAM